MFFKRLSRKLGAHKLKIQRLDEKIYIHRADVEQNYMKPNSGKKIEEPVLRLVQENKEMHQKSAKIHFAASF